MVVQERWKKTSQRGVLLQNGQSSRPLLGGGKGMADKDNNMNEDREGVLEGGSRP